MSWDWLKSYHLKDKYKFLTLFCTDHITLHDFNNKSMNNLCTKSSLLKKPIPIIKNLWILYQSLCHLECYPLKSLQILLLKNVKSVNYKVKTKMKRWKYLQRIRKQEVKFYFCINANSSLYWNSTRKERRLF